MLRFSEFIPWGQTRGPPSPAHRRKGDFPSTSGVDHLAGAIQLIEIKKMDKKERVNLKKTCKRLTSLLLVLAMVLSMVITCAAAEDSIELSSENVAVTFSSDDVSSYTVTVSYDGATLTENTDYTLTVYVGTYAICVIVEGTGTYTGNVTLYQSPGAVEIKGSGTTGDCYWVYLSSGTLDIFGKGAMGDCKRNSWPWSSYRYSITSVCIDSGVTEICNYAFYNHTNITEVSIASTITTIGNLTFYGCSKLKELVVPDGVTSIGNSLAYNCTALTSVTLSNNVTSIGTGAFYGCSGLTEITIPDSVTSLGENAFRGCSSLTSVYLGKGIEELEAYAFWGCKTLTDLYVRGDEFTTIGNYAFEIDGDIGGSGGGIDASPDVTLHYYCDTSWTIETDGENSYWTGTTSPLTQYAYTLLVELEHVNPALTSSTPETCTTDGTYYYTCATCNTDYTVTVDATGHSYEVTDFQDATCTQGGYAVYTCTAGDDEYTEYYTATGHDYQVTASEDATCTQDGYTTYTCSVCGATYTETVTATGHSWEVTEIVTEIGSDGTGGTANYTCSVCGETKNDSITAYPLTDEDLSITSYDATTGKYELTVTSLLTGATLTEGKEYTVTATLLQSKYVLRITVTGQEEYYYTGTATIDLPFPGYSSYVFYVTNEEELNEALDAQSAYIYLDDSFSVDEVVTIDYDVIIDGQGLYTISAGDLTQTSSSAVSDAILSVTGGSVTLTGLTVDGSNHARLLYAAGGASVEVAGDSVLTGGGAVNMYGGAIYIAEGGAVTLDDCQVRDSYDASYTLASTGATIPITCNHPIYNQGILNIQDGAYLTNLPTDYSAIYNAESGELNWTGGTFDVNLQGYYANTSNGKTAGAVINNRGIFNLSGGTINGFLLDDADEYSTATFGAVYNESEATFTMEGGTITGFDTGSSSGAGISFIPSGGAVHNLGVFYLNGGTITKNTDNSGVTGETENYGGSGTTLGGGGVYNAGKFYMKGGTISYNSAYKGGGVYNDTNRTYNASGAYYVGEFYMTGGTISNNTLLTDSFSSSSSSAYTYLNDANTSVLAGGSALYVAGGSTAVISGGTIEGDTELTVDLGNDENGNAVTETVRAGIAVAFTLAETRGGTSRFYATDDSDGTLIITGSPTISVGVLLINSGTSTETAVLDSYSAYTDTYAYHITNTDTIETDVMSYLVLDGGLESELEIATLTAFEATISFSNDVTEVSSSASTSITDAVYKLNRDGDLVAVYNDRVAASEDDANLFTLADGIGLYLTTTEDGDDAWAICTHSSLTYVETADATCTEAGHSDYYQCDTCGAMFDAEGNELTEDDVTTDEATGHSLTRVAAKDATCTEVGYSVTHYKCSACGALFDTIAETNELTEADVTIAATGHDWNLEDAVTENVVEATCTTAGSYDTVIYCANCGEELARATTTVPVTGHTAGTAVKENEVAATCTTTGSYDMVTYCEDCGEKLSSYTVTVAATGHTYGEGVQTVAATRYTTGVMSYTCTVCGETFTTKIAKTNASFLFDDVTNSGSYYYTAVYWAYDLGITAGTSATLFSPNGDCTRGQFVTFLWRLAGKPTPTTSASPYTDVTNTSASYYYAVLWAVENGITKGTSDTTFSPNDHVTRGQAVTFLYRYETNIVNGGVEPTVSTSNPFTDVTNTSASYYTPVLWAVANSITKGTSDTTFSPSVDCTRGQVVTFLYRYAGQ